MSPFTSHVQRPTWPEREFDFGPATTSPRRLNFYGHFKRGKAAKLRRLKAGVTPTRGSALERLAQWLLRG